MIEVYRERGRLVLREYGTEVGFIKPKLSLIDVFFGSFANEFLVKFKNVELNAIKDKILQEVRIDGIKVKRRIRIRKLKIEYEINSQPCEVRVENNNLIIKDDDFEVRIDVKFKTAPFLVIFKKRFAEFKFKNIEGLKKALGVIILEFF